MESACNVVVVSMCSERYSRRGSLEDVEYGQLDHFASLETGLQYLNGIPIHLFDESKMEEVCKSLHAVMFFCLNENETFYSTLHTTYRLRLTFTR